MLHIASDLTKLEISSRRVEDNIKMDLSEIVLEGVDWID
jgi:hypothetical protein